MSTVEYRRVQGSTREYREVEKLTGELDVKDFP